MARGKAVCKKRYGLKKRNVSVEFARLAASVVVILCHCNFFAAYGSENEALHRIMTCLLADSVGMFWLITGFYFLQQKSYGRLWLGTLKKVIVPGFLMMIFTWFFTEPVINDVAFSQNPALEAQEIKRFFISLLTFRETGIYWYVYAYILVVLIWPALKKLGKFLDKNVVFEIIFVVVTLALLILNDMNDNALCRFSYVGVFVLIPAALEVMWGHIIFRHREWLLRPAMLLPEVILFLAALVCRVNAYSYFLEHDMSSHIASWFSGAGFIMAVLFTLICMQLMGDDKEHAFDDAIRYFAGFTYPVYLVHPFLLFYAQKRGFFDITGTWLSAIFSTGVSAVLSVLIGTLVFYMGSFFVAAAIRWMCKIIFKNT